MKEDFLIALRKQGRLIILFLLTIFLPSVLLSIFGILALRNEKFRLEKQLEEEQMRITEQFKSMVGSNIQNVENVLQLITQNPSIISKEYKKIMPLLEAQKSENQILGQFFIIYSDTETWFPLVQSYPGKTSVENTYKFNTYQQNILDRAERFEYIQNNYPLAISTYEELLTSVKHKNLPGQILNHIARNLVKAKKYNEAIEVYLRIINDFPQCKSSTGIPLAITAKLQLTDCYRELHENENGLKEALGAFKVILSNWNNLSENQFKTYSSITIEAYTNILDRELDLSQFKEDYVKEFEFLQADYQNKIEQWQIVNDIKNECIPDLQREILTTNAYSQDIFRFTKTIGDKDFYILSSMIPYKSETGTPGILGAKINCNYFENDFIKIILENVRLNENTNLSITDLNGRMIFGEKTQVDELSVVTSYFNDNFPPWRIEIKSIQSDAILFKGYYKSFYFWTILTIIIILFFGVLLIMRTIMHELDVLKLKSELVSSVSHEFKTPITSIKALTERLLDQKVKDKDRINEYYSMILWDTDNLSRLVSNFLDSTKIEEGKKQYEFEETDINKWMTSIVTNFKNKCPQKGIKFNSSFSEDIPAISIDKNAMEQAINNLLDNAIKFSTGENIVDIIIEKVEKNLVIKISDNGIGINKEDLNKIFDKFYRGRNAPTYASTGTGLGLTIVRQIVEAHNGKISVDSIEGRGSTFTLILPFIK
jgi:signal transduction histidine kinase/tetratricopeptide (TPR) repeat protein